jgi:glycosyltransferase involved in cell wall biosynthesis
VAPKGNNSYQVGAGVKLTTDGINFNVIYLEERRRLFLYSSFKELSHTISQEKPDVVMVMRSTLPAFLFEFSLRKVMRSLDIKLILKDHPFRLLSYPEAVKEISSTRQVFKTVPKVVNKIITISKLDKLLRKIQLEINRKSLIIPDAHVHYVEAFDILESYCVPREKIFVTRNSPDTDSLFKTKKDICKLPKILLDNPYRIIHVGRLVVWKRVDMLIRSFANVQKQFTQAELLVIGFGPEEYKLKKLAKELKLENSVVFLGGVYEQKLLGQYLMESTLYVLAGMGGLSINDAMCFGLPIVCSECDGTEKFLVREGVNGRYFNDNDEDDLSEKIKWFFHNPERSKEMGQTSEEIIRNEININTVIKEYEKALDYCAKKIIYKTKNSHQLV